MDSADHIATMFTLIAMIALVLILAVILLVMFRVTRPQVRQFGWRVIRRTQRLPLSRLIYPIGHDFALLIMEDLRQQGQICPRLFHRPIWPMVEPAVNIVENGNYIVDFGGGTYRVSIDQSGTPSQVIVSRTINPRRSFLASMCVIMGFATGQLAVMIIGLVAILWLVLVDPYGFGFMIAQSVQRAAGSV